MKPKRQPWLIQDDPAWERYIRLLYILVLQAKGQITQEEALAQIWLEYHL